MTADRMDIVSGLRGGANIKKSTAGEYFLCDDNSDPAMEYGPLSLEDLADLAYLITQAVDAESDTPS